LVIASSGAFPIFMVIASLFVLGGLANALVNVSLILMIQRYAAPAVQSRALATIEATMNAAIGVSLVLGGLLLAQLGPRGIYLLGGGLGAVAALVAFRLPGDSKPIGPATATAARAADDNDFPDQLGVLPSPIL
jgi:predicted MFS family arabinose efflux permease